MKRTIRDLTPEDARLVVDYFVGGEEKFLRGMGVDPSKMPDRAMWIERIVNDLSNPVEKRQYNYVIWEVEGRPIGHSNINNITYGEHANMHLHIWIPEYRKNGNGSYFIKESISRYFEKYKLEKLICEPFAHNPAPNATMKKLGFRLVKKHVTMVPDWINMEQEVNRWELTKKEYESKF